MAKKDRKPTKQPRTLIREVSTPSARKGWKAEMAFVRALAAQPTRSGKNRWSGGEPRAPVLIVALDLPTLPAAAEMMHRLRPVTRWFKIGSTLFTTAGPEAVRMVQAVGGEVFLDLKFHDIPQTVAGGVAAAAGLGVSLVTVHCAAGMAAMEAAADAVRRTGSPLRVLGVTRLTSEAGRVAAIVLRAAQAARAAGLGGVVASAHECARVKAACGGDFRVLTPGIRPSGAAAHDQGRVATPREAVGAGADYLVVGRPIVAAPDPLAAAHAVAEEISAAWLAARS